MDIDIAITPTLSIKIARLIFHPDYGKHHIFGDFPWAEITERGY
jgi:hypothetical protein